MSGLSEEEVQSLVKALHDAETTGGFWGEHPECVEFANIVKPTVERILAERVAAGRAELTGFEEDLVREEALKAAADKWQQGAWLDVLNALDCGLTLQQKIATGQAVTDWLRAYVTGDRG
jgi:hypothetical protein